MSFYSAIVLIVLIVVAAGVFRSRSGKNNEIRHVHDDPQQVSSLREKELENEVESLRERVKVLERIATDPSRRTAEEIEKLRDE
ncbi:hypothetical protein [Aurantiacibacter marinus]|uniref:Uncharacterized protein n=1 Tax=Aurantiacibacter marinus TaxID=874156 RepID=A0A0H0XP78_9SPHN|nr:hypothetical protein [Aurantiacibacter marinus]KLI64164.1 hypothetical protein AAV99_00325 [Aurantiacibacter marinus]